MLFSKKKDQPEKELAPDRQEKAYPIPYSKGFKGFKRFPVVVHGDSTSETNNEQLYNVNLSECAFKFVCSTGDHGRYAILFIDNKKVGAIFDAEQVQAIEQEQIEMIHAESKEETIIGGNGTEIKRRLYYFVKYKEKAN